MSSLGSGDLGYDGYSVTLNYFTALPNPNIIPDAKIAVFFKSLLKKDSITKEKSLGELLEALNDKQNESSIQDDLTIISWVQSYPKLAIDNSRTVRILAHQVQSKFLQVVGGKAYSKHLKSSLPVWVLGLFDSDKVVATATYRSFLDSFQDKERVDKVWIIFYDQILNFIITAITLETHESLSDKRYTKEVDSLAKYERVLNGCLLMLVKIIGLFNNGTLTTTPELETILTSDTIWEYLGTCISDNTLNLLLFKTILVLIKTLFDSNDNKPNKFIMSLNDSKGIYKVVSKKFIKNVKLKPSSKSASAGILYSNVIIQFWDTLSTLTEFTSLPIESLKIKKNFWQLGGSKSYSRLVDYLKLGFCNLDPTYYKQLTRFFKAVHELEFSQDDEFLDFKNTKHAETILVKVLCTQVKSSRSVIEKTSCIECLLEIYPLFLDDSSEILKVVFYSIVDSISKPIRANEKEAYEKLTKNIAVHLKNSIDEEFFQDINLAIITLIEKDQSNLVVNGFSFDSTNVFNTYLAILEESNLREVSTKVISQVITKLEEDSSLEKPKLAFLLISSYLSITKTVTSDLESFLESLPSYLTVDFVEPVLNLFADFVSSSKGTGLSQSIDDFFLELTRISSEKVPGFLLSVQEHLHDEKLKDITLYLVELSKKEFLTEIESKLIYNFVSNPDVLENLIESSTKSETGSLRFIKEFSSHEVTELEENHHLNSIVQVAWRFIGEQDVSKFLLKFKLNTLEGSLFGFIHSSTYKTDFKDVSAFVQGKKELFDLIVSQLTTSVKGISNNDLAISNPLQQNLYLAKGGDVELQPKIIIYARLISDLLAQDKDDSLAILAAFASEYVDDYLFLESKVVDSEIILQIKANLQKGFLDAVGEATLDNILKEEESSVILQLKSKIINDGLGYAARSLKLVLDGIFDKISLSTFEATEINFTQLAKTPLLFAVFLLSGSKFFANSTKYDRIRNFAAAEILGVRKESEILTFGLQWITLSTNFFNSEEQYESIPVNRLAMVITQISKWLDSDIAYDDEFIVMRVQLARFLNGLLLNQPDVPDKTWDVAVRLISDNLSTCQVEQGRRDLRFFTLKLLNTVNRKTDSNEWDASKNEIFEELLDLIVSNEVVALDSKAQNQAVALTHDLINRVYHNIEFSKSILNEKINDFYSLVSYDFVPLQRLAVSTLRKVIIANQQDFVVEYQLQKPSDMDIEAKLPAILLKNIDIEYPEDIEPSTVHSISTYLWSWCLIFYHFEDITYSMRSEYLSQFKETNSINTLLNYIFEQVDVTDVKFLQKLTLGKLGQLVKPEDNLIKNYDSSEGCPGEDFEFELNFLLMHLYYLSFRFLGSHIQTWFNEIRDLQLKQKVEKFSIKFVSPLLVSKLLTEVTQVKDKVESKDENLTIKVNGITNEIKSTYIIDEQTMEMVIKVPFNYPLNNVIVDGPLRLGVKENQWKAWLLASQRVISLANGSIMDAIEVFNKNVNLHFSGFEECAICYSILHQDLSLPSKNCPTCSNKFHAACLYKWFKSSGSSTCPLCRSSFTFRNTRSVAV